MSRSDNMTGAVLMMASMAAFTINDTLMKMLAGAAPLNQLLFLRGVLMTVALIGLVWWVKAYPRGIPNRDWWLIALRALAETFVIYFFLTALFNMPLANITAILQALPLTITLAAAVFLKEPAGWRRITAILVGFVGVLLIVRPGAADFNFYSMYGLAAVACITCRDLITRRLSPQTPSLFVTLVATVTVTVIFGAFSLRDTWAPMGMRDLGTLIAAAAFVTIGFLSAVMVMRVGEVSYTIQFRYSGLLWALLLGWVVFGDWPDALTMIGASLVVGSGMFTLLREARLAQKKSSEPDPHRH
ncbi:EamA-like transporter family protein [Roseovarius albus]|uniref:EamA-like transporter family protein n=1 Tax=Roseovarius albus TaxID=1247867 RepID=A0A1X7A5Y9_9RHOB|nr:DMT family transporter [Roseovarius albus]SLN71427.1 EamA-like transporter family protein [Roseovarius albus]